jgi:hypothetical protein
MKWLNADGNLKVTSAERVKLLFYMKQIIEVVGISGLEMCCLYLHLLNWTWFKNQQRI